MSSGDSADINMLISLQTYHQITALSHSYTPDV